MSVIHTRLFKLCDVILKIAKIIKKVYLFVNFNLLIYIVFIMQIFCMLLHT